MTAIILDTETTRIENPEVIELAWANYQLGIGTTSGECRRYKPRFPPEFGAMAVHHILMSELDNEPPSERAPHDVPKADYWIGHNIDFDWKVLGQPPVRRICTLAMARAVWPECDSHSQSALTYFLFGATPEVRERLRSAHSAAADIMLTAAILFEIVQARNIPDLAALHRFSEESRIPRVFTFGKFKGQPIAAADRGYANWYNRQPDPDPYLLEAFRRAGLL